MGIMYKLMKHKKLDFDLENSQINTNIKNDRSRLITIEGNIIEAEMPATKDSAEDDLSQTLDCNMDKQFTAEHIIQLCKFLAEKSRKNKSLYKQQQSPKKQPKSKQLQFTFQNTKYNDICDDVDFLNKQKLQHHNHMRPDEENIESDEFDQERNVAVLSARLSPDINSLNISLNTSSCALQHHQQPQNITSYEQQHQEQHQPQQPQTQGKRDILLKIRRQIIERKRLRENGALNNSQVWRPW